MGVIRALTQPEREKCGNHIGHQFKIPELPHLRNTGHALEQVLAKFFLKGQTVNILGFVDHLVSCNA